MKRTLIALAAIGLLALPACGGTSDEEPSTSPTAGLANPASVFCEQQGGTVEIVDEAGGQVGYCILPDGTRIEEWEYFRSMNPQPTASSSDAWGTASPSSGEGSAEEEAGETEEQEDEESAG